MLRNLVILGVSAVAAAAVPVLYEADPEAFHALLRPAREVPAEVRVVAKPVDAPRRAALSGRKVRLDADQRGHFSGEFRLNGQRVEALVDTGATLVAINRSTARRIGVVLTQADFRYEVATANGTVRAAAAVIDRLEIGRISVENVEAFVLDDRALSGTLVGMSFLRRLDRYQVEDGSLLLVQ